MLECLSHLTKSPYHLRSHTLHITADYPSSRPVRRELHAVGSGLVLVGPDAAVHRRGLRGRRDAARSVARWRYPIAEGQALAYLRAAHCADPWHRTLAGHRGQAW
jgi:hypothetical protein